MEQYLSLELVSNILSRLPVKELLRCKCVCKSWLDLITDPCFITNHHVVYNNNLTRHKERLLVTRSIHKYSHGEKTQISILSWDPKGLVVSSEVLTPSYGYDSHQRLAPHIMGPCNGIYYLSEGVGNPNIMTNFSLRQCRVLPKSHLTPPPHKTYISCFNCVGFGFDPKTNDYKVLVAKDLWLKNVQMEFWWVEFYSLNSNSWRKSDNSLNMSLPFSATSCGSVYTYVRNCCHWGFRGTERGTVDDVVISFDMVNEAFRIIRAPSLSDSYSSKQAHQTLAPFDESSTIGVIVNIPLVGRLDVWVMRDYWDDGSWVK